MSTRFNNNHGIAIGMILFVVALLGVIAIAMTAGSNVAGTTIVPDRVAADVKTQANLIRNKILECYTYGYERGDLADKYPASTGTGTPVEDLVCPAYNAGTNNIWNGQSPAMLPPPTTGFDKWVYVNAGTAGGRCIRIQPTSGNANDQGLKNGLAQASSYFAANELVYSSGSGSQRFILWISRPSGTPSTDCDL
jgi:hypothetical protein